MANESEVSREQIKAMAEAVQLDLPVDRLETLGKMYAHFLEGFAKIREIDTGDREPPTLVPHKQAEQ